MFTPKTRNAAKALLLAVAVAQGAQFAAAEGTILPLAPLAGGQVSHGQSDMALLASALASGSAADQEVFNQYCDWNIEEARGLEQGMRRPYQREVEYLSRRNREILDTFLKTLGPDGQEVISRASRIANMFTQQVNVARQARESLARQQGEETNRVAAEIATRKNALQAQRQAIVDAQTAQTEMVTSRRQAMETARQNYSVLYDVRGRNDRELLEMRRLVARRPTVVQGSRPRQFEYVFMYQGESRRIVKSGTRAVREAQSELRGLIAQLEADSNRITNELLPNLQRQESEARNALADASTNEASQRNWAAELAPIDAQITELDQQLANLQTRNREALEAADARVAALEAMTPRVQERVNAEINPVFGNLVGMLESECNSDTWLAGLDDSFQARYRRPRRNPGNRSHVVQECMNNIHPKFSANGESGQLGFCRSMPIMAPQGSVNAYEVCTTVDLQSLQAGGEVVVREKFNWLQSSGRSAHWNQPVDMIAAFVDPACQERARERINGLATVAQQQVADGSSPRPVTVEITVELPAQQPAPAAAASANEAPVAAEQPAAEQAAPAAEEAAPAEAAAE